MTYYLKFLTADGLGTYSEFPWPLPTDGQPGAWVTVEGDLVVCENGIHASTLGHAPGWVHDAAYLIEFDGDVETIGAEDAQVIGRRARLVRRLDWDWRSAQRYAADCAEHVLPIWLAVYPDDDRPRLAIAARRRWANGEIDEADWYAARDAAWNAAWYAAMDAAKDAARAAGYTGGDTVWYAAWYAARAAAWYAARAAERAWQAARLAEYLNLQPGEVVP